MNGEFSTNILVDAKKEYTKHIYTLLGPIILSGFQNIYDNCRDECEKKGDQHLLTYFQDTLKEIPKWNQDVINQEYDRIVQEDNCDLLDDLVKAVFLFHIKILSSVSMSEKPKKVQLEIPSTKRFIHHCYIEASKDVNRNPFLFDHLIDDYQYRLNVKDIAILIQGAIENAITKLVPIRSILAQYMRKTEINADDLDKVIEDIHQSPKLSPQDKREMEDMIQHEKDQLSEKEKEKNKDQDKDNQDQDQDNQDKDEIGGGGIDEDDDDEMILQLPPMSRAKSPKSHMSSPRQLFRNPNSISDDEDIEEKYLELSPSRRKSFISKPKRMSSPSRKKSSVKIHKIEAQEEEEEEDFNDVKQIQLGASKIYHSDEEEREGSQEEIQMHGNQYRNKTFEFTLDDVPDKDLKRVEYRKQNGEDNIFFEDVKEEHPYE